MMNAALTTANGKQLDLFAEFQLGPVHLSRILPSWDLLFPFLFTKTKAVPPDTKVSEIPTRSYEFSESEATFRITVAPAFIGDKGTKPQIIYAGEREELVATAIRALFTRGEIAATIDQAPAPKTGAMHSMIVLPFYIRQLRDELARTSHTLSHTEIDQALEVLARTQFSLENFIEGQESVKAPAIPYYQKYLKRGDQRVIYLNEIEAGQILRGAYRAIDNELMLRLRSGLARWLYKYIHSEHRNAEKPTEDKVPNALRVSYSLLLQRGVLTPTAQIKDGVERVRAALRQLEAQGTFHPSKEAPHGWREEQLTAPTKGRRRLVDVTWLLYVSLAEVEQIIAANAEAKYRAPVHQGRFSPRERLTLTAEARKDLCRPRSTPQPKTALDLIPERLFPAQVAAR